MKIHLVNLWRARIDDVRARLGDAKGCSERAVGEAQGYVRAMTECADALERWILSKQKRRN